jgi:hypothetical protein
MGPVDVVEDQVIVVRRGQDLTPEGDQGSRTCQARPDGLQVGTRNPPGGAVKAVRAG